MTSIKLMFTMVVTKISEKLLMAAFVTLLVVSPSLSEVTDSRSGKNNTSNRLVSQCITLIIILQRKL